MARADLSRQLPIVVGTAGPQHNTQPRNITTSTRTAHNHKHRPGTAFPLAWLSKKQGATFRSTTEAETVVLSYVHFEVAQAQPQTHKHNHKHTATNNHKRTSTNPQPQDTTTRHDHKHTTTAQAQRRITTHNHSTQPQQSTTAHNHNTQPQHSITTTKTMFTCVCGVLRGRWSQGSTFGCQLETLATPRTP